MTRQRVLKCRPRAALERPYAQLDLYEVWDYARKPRQLLGYGCSETAAWVDAAKTLRLKL